MGDSKDLGAQIDALLAGKGNNPAPAPADPAPAPQPPEPPEEQAGEQAAVEDAPAEPNGEGDLAGMALADEIQELLDEAAAEGSASDAPAEPETVAEPEAAIEPEELAQPAEPATEEDIEKQLISQIDQMLAEQAGNMMEKEEQTPAAEEDAASGEFASVKDVVGDEPAAQETDADPQAAVDDMFAQALAEANDEAAEPVSDTEEDDTLEVEGDFESVENILDEEKQAEASPEEAPAEAATDDASVEGEMESVDDVLEEDKSSEGEEVEGDIASVDDVMSEDDAPAEETVDMTADDGGGEATMAEELSAAAAAVAAELDEEAADEAAAPAEEQVAEQPEEAQALRPAAKLNLAALIAKLDPILEKINRPFAKLPENVRQTLGWIGLTQVALAGVLLLYALFLK